jgi:hypothetical protein
MADKCPKCGTEMHWLAGAKAHQDNQYCPQKACGYEAWNQEPKMTEPNKQEFVSASKDANKQVTETEALEAVRYGERAAFRFQLEQPPAEAGEAVATVNLHGALVNAQGVLADIPPGTKLYTSQTTATQAAVAAAMRGCADPLHKLIEYCDMSNDAQYGTLSASLVRDLVNDAFDSIPVEATAALDAYVQEKCMEVAEEVHLNGIEADWDHQKAKDLDEIVRDVLNKNRGE